MTYQDWTDPEFARKWSEKRSSRNPLRPQQLEMLLAILEDEFEPGKTIIDLGYGSGIVEQMIFERMPHAQIVGVDRSEAMMALAAERLKPYPFRFVPVRHDLAELASILGPSSPLPRQQYQVAISIQALHHLTPEQMQAAYFTLYDILEPKGLFLLMDRIAVSTPALWSVYASLWRLLEQQHGVNIQEGDSYEEHAAFVKAGGDLPAPLEDHLCWLRDAGFEAACLHLHSNRALIAARKT
jgi:SAM-dependent methyltransferase